MQDILESEGNVAQLRIIEAVVLKHVALRDCRAASRSKQYAIVRKSPGALRRRKTNASKSLQRVTRIHWREVYASKMALSVRRAQL
jgi:hypothetical protein